MHEISPLISLTELAVGFGRKRDALAPDTAHGEILHIHPKDPKKNQIQLRASKTAYTAVSVPPFSTNSEIKRDGS